MSADRAGLLGDVSDVFNRRALNVTKCKCETFENGVCRDEFEVVAADTGRPLADAAAREQLQQAVYDCVTEEAPRATTLRVAAPDRPGLLQQIASSLDALSLSVVGARVSTVDGSQETSAMDTFDVVRLPRAETDNCAGRLRDRRG